MYVVYILKSLKTGRYYIGHAEDLLERMARHNRGAVKSTKNGRPWRVVYTEVFTTKAEAYRRELEIKSYEGGIQFKALLKKKDRGEVA